MHHERAVDVAGNSAGHDHSGHDHSGHDHGSHDHDQGMGGHSMMSMVVRIRHFAAFWPIGKYSLLLALHFQFHFGVKEVILFDQWSTESAAGLFGSVIVIMLMAACYEGLKYYREYLFWKTYNSLQYRAVTLPEKAAVVGASSEDNTRVQ